MHLQYWYSLKSKKASWSCVKAQLIKWVLLICYFSLWVNPYWTFQAWLSSDQICLLISDSSASSAAAATAAVLCTSMMDKSTKHPTNSNKSQTADTSPISEETCRGFELCQQPDKDILAWNHRQLIWSRCYLCFLFLPAVLEGIQIDVFSWHRRNYSYLYVKETMKLLTLEVQTLFQGDPVLEIIINLHAQTSQYCSGISSYTLKRSQCSHASSSGRHPVM